MYTYMPVVKVASLGPPFVKIYGSSNSCRVLIVDIMEVNRIIGFKCGRVNPKFCVNSI